GGSYAGSYPFVELYRKKELETSKHSVKKQLSDFELQFKNFLIEHGYYDSPLEKSRLIDGGVEVDD
ncbi:MAG: hypothetical protein Q4P17_03890, partial [Methanobacterium sp.]|nr:hypothetical protein [Methanobacterium sp.]